MTPDDRQTASTEAPGRRRQADLERAIAAAQQARLGGYRVEIAPDGAITIVVGASFESDADAEACTDLRGL